MFKEPLSSVIFSMFPHRQSVCFEILWLSGAVRGSAAWNSKYLPDRPRNAKKTFVLLLSFRAQAESESTVPTP
jgi:hypothetical protein